MNNINFGRVLLGGLVTGLVLNIGEFLLNGVVLAKQMEAQFFRKLNIPPPTPSSLAVLVVITFVLGIVIVFVYAAIRPRFGAGPKTAVITGLTAWFCVYLYGNVGGVALGFIPVNMAAIAIAWGVVEYLLGTLAGAWLYKEA